MAEAPPPSDVPFASWAGHADDLQADVIIGWLHSGCDLTDSVCLSGAFSRFWRANVDKLNQQPATIVIAEFTDASLDDLRAGNVTGATYINVRRSTGVWEPPDADLLSRIIVWKSKLEGHPVVPLGHIGYWIAGAFLFGGSGIFAWRRRRRKRLAMAAKAAPLAESLPEVP